jgi:hypothetical protein
VGVGVGVAAAAGWMLVRRDALSADGAGARLKGVGVEVYRRRGERVELLPDDARVRAGDGLRITLTLPAAGPVSLWFVDADGHVDAFPDATSLPLAAGPNVLPGAVVVDAPCRDLELHVRTAQGEYERSLRCE